MRGRTVYTCEICGTEYFKKEHYERHVRVHTRERPFACSQCPAKFPRRDTLRRHRRARHPNSNSDLPIQSGTTSPINDEGSNPVDAPSQCFPTVVAEQAMVDHSTDHVTSMSSSIDQSIPLSLDGFDWQWDAALNLDSSFFVEDLRIYSQDFDPVGAVWHQIPAPGSGPVQPRALAPGFPARRNGVQESSRPVPVDRSPNDGSATSPLDGTPGSGVDESSRGMLSMSLDQRIPETNLPSTAFLNRCIYLYTTRVWPMVPVIHLPTFMPARMHPFLLLVICAVGALADGSDLAFYHAVRMFEGVRKAILVSFTLESANPEHSFAMLQAGVVGQTCAILSGRAEHLLIARSFHGAMSVLLQDYLSNYVQSRIMKPLEAQDAGSSPTLSSDWQRWIHEQTTARLHNAIQIHNGELAAIVHSPAQTRTHAAGVQFAEPDNLFLAKSAEEWRTMRVALAATERRPVAVFSCCAELEQIIAEISHQRFSGNGSETVRHRAKTAAALIEWLERRRDSIPMDRPHRLSPVILWHSCFLLLDCDLKLMEQRYSADWHDSDARSHSLSLASLQEWAQSKAALDATRHAILIMRNLEHLRVSEPPALHVGRCVWNAGLVLAVYSAHACDESNVADQEPSSDLSNCSELLSAWRVGVVNDHDWSMLNQATYKEHCRTMAYSLCTILRSLGPWGNAAWFAMKLAKVLEVMEAQCAGQ